jgi:hypothetical protein
VNPGAADTFPKVQYLRAGGWAKILVIVTPFKWRPGVRTAGPTRAPATRRLYMRFMLVTAAVISLAVSGLAQSGEQAAPKSSKYTAEQIKKAKPAATVELDAAQFGLLVGGATGKGTLTYQGKAYPFTIKAGSAGSLGVTKVHATGNV